MRRKNIVILGGGFAGLSALDRLCALKKACREPYDMVLVDRKKSSEFLPMLPDLVSGRIPPEVLSVDLASRCGRRGADFLLGNARAVNTENKEIVVDGSSIPYDYLVMSTGAESDFFGMDKLGERCLKVYDVDDAMRLKRVLTERASDSSFNVVIAGGGYTGIEIATNARILFNKLRKDNRIIILEKAEDILMMTPEWMRASARRELERSGIELRCGETLVDITGEGVLLGSGDTVKSAVCVWSAGVRSADILGQGEVDRERTRVKVDECLRPSGPSGVEGVFCAGDSAAFPGRRTGAPIRMAVMFAIAEGRVAAENIVRSIKGTPLLKYKPKDLGYLIPLAGGRAPGIILGKKVDGRFGFIMHYFMCLYRSSFRNRLGILKAWINDI